MAVSTLNAAATVAAVGRRNERASATGTSKLVSFRSSSVFGGEGGVKKRWVDHNDGRLEKRVGATGTGKLLRCAAVNSVLADTPGELMKLQEHVLKERVADPKNVASLILSGGAGTRLFPLTRTRAKPAVSIGGSYRLIDVAVSNCINSGINKVYILTQFNSHSLNNHINRTYNSPGRIDFGDGFVEVLAAMQTAGKPGQGWFQGTADAVRQFLWIFEDAKFSHIDNILILAGDHLYRMDYVQFLQKHVETEADVTVACVPVDESSACDNGLFKIDRSGRICQFIERPKGDALRAMKVEASIVGLSTEEAEKCPYIATMGIYVFKTSALQKLLRHSYPSANDFRSEIIPMAAKDVVVKAYVFKGYWQDIGTIRTFFDANLELTRQPSKFEFYDHTKPIYTSARFLPPTQYGSCKISSSIISHGCFLEGRCKVEHSVVGARSRLGPGVELKDTMMMGADYYETDEEIQSILANGEVTLGVGRDSKIENCIIEKNARIGRNVVIANVDNVEEAERPSEGHYIRSGITIILKNVTIPDGTII